MSKTDEIDVVVDVMAGSESTAEIPADTPSGRFFAPVQETLHLSGLSYEQRRWSMDDTSLAEEHRLIVSTASEVWQYPVRKEVIVGSADRCHVILPGPGVSQTHLALNTDGELFWFRCLEIGSEILVDGKATQEGWLRGGEELRVGDVRIYFMVPDRLKAKARIPVPFESTEIKDHSKVLKALRTGSQAASDSYNQLVSVPVALAEEEHDVLEAPGSATMETAAPGSTGPNTRLVWAAIVVFCVGVIAVLTAGGLHLRARRQAKRAKAVAARAAARSASLLAFRRAAVRAQLTRQLAQARTLLAQQSWAKAALAFEAFLRTPGVDAALGKEAQRLLRVAKREGAAATALTKAQALSIQEGKAREVLDLIKQVPDQTKSARGASLLRLTVIKELRYQLKMCKVMHQTQKLAAARTMLAAWFRAVRSPVEAQDLGLAGEYLSAQALSAALGNIALPLSPTRDGKGTLASQGTVSKRDKDALEWLALGKLAFRMGRLEKSLRSFERAQKLTSNPMIRKRARKAFDLATQFKLGITKGLQAAARKQFAKAIPLLASSIAANRAFGRKDRVRLLRAMATMRAYRGVALLRKEAYEAAVRDFREAHRLVPRHPVLRRGWRSLGQKADQFLADARVLQGVDVRECQNILRRVLRMTTTSMQQHHRAKKLLAAR